MSMFNSLQQHLLNDWQRDFPLEPTPFAHMAKQTGVAEEEIVERLKFLQRSGAISRIGAVVRPGAIGASTLAAMAVPGDRLEDVAGRVSAYAQVNHNYEREHFFNLWFVVTASNEDALNIVLDDIEGECGFPVMSLPLVEAYHIDLGFDLGFSPSKVKVTAREATHTETARAQPEDLKLLWQLESGLPLVSRPYEELGHAIAMSEDEVIFRLGKLVETGIIRRLGVVVRHHEVGYGANAMVVWDVPDSLMADAVDHLISDPCVTLCYQRPRRLPEWPYNLFAMIHGTSEQTVRSNIAELQTGEPLSQLNHDILFSRRRFKQTGASYKPCALPGESREVA